MKNIILEANKMQLTIPHFNFGVTMTDDLYADIIDYTVEPDTLELYQTPANRMALFIQTFTAVIQVYISQIGHYETSYPFSYLGVSSKTKTAKTYKLYIKKSDSGFLITE